MYQIVNLQINNIKYRKIGTYIVLLFVICYHSTVFSQEPAPQFTGKDKFKLENPGLDTLPAPNSPFSDTLSIDIPISDQKIDEQIEHGAVDTQWVDVEKNQIHLIGDAYVKYQDNEINAGYIIFDFVKKEAFAQSIEGKKGAEIGKPSFKSSGQTFQYNKMKFNFETQKGIVYEAFTQQGEYFIHGAVTKFVSKAADSMIVDDVVFNKNALITTCNHPHPHYGIRSSKLKLIPDKLAVIGPSRLEIAGIPTPLFIPFAFMPVIQNERSGIIFGGQQGFEFSEQLGFGFREIGYYWALNDYLDLKVTGDIYSRGSYGLRVATNYAKRYKFRGNLQLGFSKQFTEVEGARAPNVNSSFTFGLSHNQDAKAHPYLKVGGNLRFTTNDFDRNNYNDAQSQLENIINSNFRISHSLPSLDALSLNITIGHSQNTRTRKIDFTLPNVELRMRTIYPFKRKKSSGKEKWYEKINMKYNSQLKNFVSTRDTILFTSETLDRLQTGMSHKASAGASFNVLEYFQLSPSVNYEETWVLKTLEKDYNPRYEYSTDPFTNEQDSTFIRIDDNFNSGFARYNNVRANLNLSTNLFGTMLFKKGRLRGLRHTIKPSVGMTFTPSTERYIRTVQRSDDPDDLLEYTEFDGGIFRSPNPGEQQMAMTYSITNNFEGKYFSKKDSTEKKFKIFNTIGINGNHNFVADSLKWSRVSMRGNASLLGRISRLTFSATFDPYIEQNNRRINTTVWSEKKRPVRFENFSSAITTGFTVKDIRDFFRKRKEGREEDEEDEDQIDEELLLDQLENEVRNQPFGSSIRDEFETRKDFERIEQLEGENDEEDQQISFLDILESFRIGHTIEYRVDVEDEVSESRIRTNSIQMSGSIPLTDNWNLNVGNFSYDFVNKRFVYPSISIRRDLHCWDMQFRWQPARGTFSFFIAVKSPQLGGFLKYNYGRNQFDRF